MIFKRNKYKVSRKLTKMISHVGLSKLYRFSDQDTYITACTTTDKTGLKNEKTLIILNSYHDLIAKSFPIEQELKISDIAQVEKSRFAFEISDLPKIYGRTEYRMDSYLKTVVSVQLSDEKKEINPKNLSEHFLLNIDNHPIRLVYGEMNSELISNVTNFETISEENDLQLIIDNDFIKNLQTAITYNSASSHGSAERITMDMVRAIIKGNGLLIKETGQRITTIEDYKEWKQKIEHLGYINTDEMIKKITTRQQ